ncbi:hypothetical protein CPLU01_14876 [Colletotrichum plurivorum]|uniref:F-box domain-containing protein n=1 Tax=Colletotrichum plurivorum TaxID=2175906 RepID=A0A8H6MY44_9PEZI|nr:hypothetical protein CPLU01_14876 [Colletotrichum plurivorum]
MVRVQLDLHQKKPAITMPYIQIAGHAAVSDMDGIERPKSAPPVLSHLDTEERLENSPFAVSHMDIQAPEMADDASGDDQAAESQISTWNANNERNYKESSLVRLDKTLRLKIMYLVDPADLYFLRQSCYAFFHLFYDESFARFRATCEDQEQHVMIFNISVVPSPYEIRNRATRLNLCNECHAAKMDKESYDGRSSALLKPQACEPCGSFHSLLHFPEQSMKGAQLFAKHKRCVCWEGRVRLCDHRRVSLSTVCRSAEKRKGRLPQTLRNTLVKCDTCLKTAMNGVSRSGRSRHVVPPSFTLTLNKSLSGALSFTGSITWTLPVCMVETDQDVTDRFLLEKLSVLKRSHGDGLLCPHFTFDDSRLLRPFDPRECSCLGGDTRVGGRIEDDEQAPFGISSVRGICNVVSGLDVPSAVPGECKFMASGEEYGLYHSVVCEVCHAIYNWVRHYRVVFLQRMQDITWTSEDDKTRFGRCSRVVDPASYGTQLDSDRSLSKNILWCEDIKCRNGKGGGRLRNKLGYSPGH